MWHRRDLLLRRGRKIWGAYFFGLFISFQRVTESLVWMTKPAWFSPTSARSQVDILSKLPKTEFNQKLAATKWSEILEGLNIAVDMIGAVPKLTAGDYGDLVQKVKRLGDHSHVQVK